MPEGVEEVPAIGIIYPPPEVRSILYSTTIHYTITFILFKTSYFISQHFFFVPELLYNNNSVLD